MRHANNTPVRTANLSRGKFRIPKTFCAIAAQQHNNDHEMWKLSTKPSYHQNSADQVGVLRYEGRTNRAAMSC